MNRRNFLHSTLAGTAGLSLAPGMLSGCMSGHDPLHDFGIITIGVQNMMREDHRATMALLAEMGYRYLEFGGTWDEEPDALQRFMDGIGLVPLAGGASLADMQGDDLLANIDECLALGKKYLVCYWPWMGDPLEPTWDMVNFAVDEFHRMGEQCKKKGLRFAFHNHYHEFQVLDDQVIYEYILENTDPELITMEVDLYWARKGGADIRQYFEKYPGRFEIVHVKDSYDSPDLESFACVGSGIIDFPELFSYRDIGGFKHLIVEHDHPENEEACARSSIDHLKSLKF
jgi:sugar phosphate isomerase/epimerase